MDEQAGNKGEKREPASAPAAKGVQQKADFLTSARLKTPAILNKVDPREFHGHMKDRGRDWFYFLHGAADLCLLASGHLTDNAGRFATGALGVGRNASWFLLKKVAMRSHADIMTSFAAAASNIPQLVTSASVPESIAVSLVVAAYTMRGGTRLGRSLIETHSSFNQPSPEDPGVLAAFRHKFKDAFNETSGGVLMKLPPFLLMGRAVMQLTDGVMREDYSAIAAGAVFMIAATGLMIFDNRNVGPRKAEDLVPS